MAFGSLNGTLSIENVSNYLNTITIGDSFWTVILFTMYVIIFFVIKDSTPGINSGVKSFTAASFIGAILGIVLFMIQFNGVGLVNVDIIYLFVGLTTIGSIATLFAQRF